MRGQSFLLHASNFCDSLREPARAERCPEVLTFAEDAAVRRRPRLLMMMPCNANGKRRWGQLEEEIPANPTQRMAIRASVGRFSPLQPTPCLNQAAGTLHTCWSARTAPQ